MFSVIIPTYNKNEITKVHVERCMQCSIIPDEIIVVNDGGEKTLEKILCDIKRNTTLIYAHIDQDIAWNYTGAKNLGLWLSTGDYVCFEDNDHIPSIDFYKDAFEKMSSDPTLDIIYTGGRYIVSEQDVISNMFSEWKILGKRNPAKGIGIMKRECILKLKGFDERFAGEYGFHTSDIIKRYKRLGLNSRRGKEYFVIDGGNNKLDILSSRNHRFYKENKKSQLIQTLYPILNFSYSYTKYEKNS